MAVTQDQVNTLRNIHDELSASLASLEARLRPEVDDINWKGVVAVARDIRIGARVMEDLAKGYRKEVVGE